MIPVGVVIGDYTVEQKLPNDGSSGAAYVLNEVSDPEQKAVLKLLLKAHDAREKTRFDQENRILYDLKGHESIADVYSGVLSCIDGPYYILEYFPINFNDLYYDLAELGVQTNLEIVLGIARGLKHAHEHKITHRDLHPGNIMFRGAEYSGYGVKIIDFGRALDQNELLVLSSSNTVGWGLIYFMPPEVYFRALDHEDIKQTSLADIYSLGMIMHTFFGTPPIDHSTNILRDAAAYYRNHGLPGNRGMLSPAVDIKERKKHYRSWLETAEPKFNNKLIIELTGNTASHEVTESINKIIKRACAIDCTKRYQSINDMIVDIEALI